MKIKLPCGCEKGIVKGLLLLAALRCRRYRVFDRFHGPTTLSKKVG